MKWEVQWESPIHGIVSSFPVKVVLERNQFINYLLNYYARNSWRICEVGRAVATPTPFFADGQRFDPHGAVAHRA